MKRAPRPDTSRRIQRGLPGGGGLVNLGASRLKFSRNHVTKGPFARSDCRHGSSTITPSPSLRISFISFPVVGKGRVPRKQLLIFANASYSVLVRAVCSLASSDHFRFGSAGSSSICGLPVGLIFSCFPKHTCVCVFLKSKRLEHSSIYMKSI